MKILSKSMIVILALNINCAFSTPLRADNSQILNALKQEDKALKQGSISYDEIQKSPIGATSLQTSIDYTSDGRYHEISTGSVNGRPQSYEIIFDGNDELWIFPKQKEIQFKIPKSSGLFGATPGLYYAIGHGLSNLTNMMVTSDSTGIRLTGNDENGMKFEAILDQAHAYVAKEITRRDQQGVITGKWSFSSPQDIGDGIYVAMKSVSDIGLRTHIHSDLSVKKMSVHEPKPNRFTYEWLKPGFQIVDLRLGSTDMGKFQSGGIPRNTTSTQLLEMSKQQIALRAKLHATNYAAKKTYEQQSTTKPIALIVTLVCLTGTIIAAVITWRKRSA